MAASPKLSTVKHHFYFIKKKNKKKHHISNMFLRGYFVKYEKNKLLGKTK